MAAEQVLALYTLREVFSLWANISEEERFPWKVCAHGKLYRYFYLKNGKKVFFPNAIWQEFQAWQREKTSKPDRDLDKVRDLKKYVAFHKGSLVEFNDPIDSEKRQNSKLYFIIAISEKEGRLEMVRFTKKLFKKAKLSPELIIRPEMPDLK
jgi:hypothetical protein